MKYEYEVDNGDSRDKLFRAPNNVKIKANKKGKVTLAYELSEQFIADQAKVNCKIKLLGKIEDKPAAPAEPAAPTAKEDPKGSDAKKDDANKTSEADEARALAIKGLIEGLAAEGFTDNGVPKLTAINKAAPEDMEKVTAEERDAVWLKMQAQA